MRTRMAEYDQLCAKLLKESGANLMGRSHFLQWNQVCRGRGLEQHSLKRHRHILRIKTSFYIPIQDAIIHFYDTHGMHCVAKQKNQNPYQKKQTILYLPICGNRLLKIE